MMVVVHLLQDGNLDVIGVADKHLIAIDERLVDHTRWSWDLDVLSVIRAWSQPDIIDPVF